MGGEREPVMFSALIAILVAFGGFTILSFVTGLIFWLIAVIAFRQMARHDPIMSRIWFRYIKQQTYYPAQSSVWRL